MSAQVSGSWGAWSAWNNCSTGGGIKMRTRQCDSPLPANGGEYCPGKPSEFKICKDNIQCELNKLALLLVLVIHVLSFTRQILSQAGAPGLTGLRALRAVEEELRPGGDSVTVQPRPRGGQTAMLINTKSCPTSGKNNILFFCSPFLCVFIFRQSCSLLHIVELFLIIGFIISGGVNKGVELFNPSSGNSCPVSCPIKDLQRVRSYHTSCSGLVCGGGNSPSARETCERINGTDTFPLPSLTFRQERRNHLCWSLPGDNKILLLGGSSSPTTTEIVSASSSSYSFDLPYQTK